MSIKLGSLLLALGLSGCGLIEAATSDRPNSTQRDAMGDIFDGMATFATMVDDPAGATDGDFADLHATAPYGQLLDPAGTGVQNTLTRPTVAVSPAGCATRTETSATWDCDFNGPTGTCHATGGGMKNADGTYSGSSTQTCEGSEAVVTVSATNLVFDKESGMGGGVVTVQMGTPTAVDYATVTLDDIGFCLGGDPVAPNSGRLIVDGLGPLDGLPYDPLTLKFTNDPACGTTLID